MPLKNARVKDFMQRRFVTLGEDMDVLDAIHELVEHNIPGAPVLDNKGELVGMLTEFDCLRVGLTAGYHGDKGGPVSEFMSRDTVTVDADRSIVDLANRFVETGYRRLPVTHDNRLVGVIARRDVLRALLELAR